MSPPRILIIDDDPQILEVLSRVPSQRGFEIDIAADGEAGLEVLRRGAPDVVFLDMGMPGVSGLDVLRHIPRDEMDVHVIAISDHPLAEELLGPDCLRLVAADFFVKPFDLDAVGKKLEDSFGPSEA